MDVLEVDAANKPVPMLGGDAKVRAMFRSKTGDWFSRTVMVEDLGKLRTLYRDAGYASVEADPETELDPSARSMRLRIPIRRGPIVTLDRVQVSPATATQVVAPVATRLGVTTGARYAETALTTLKAELAKSGVEVDVVQAEVKGHPDRVTITIEVR
jgi:outer membrane protein insertion porin family